MNRAQLTPYFLVPGLAVALLFAGCGKDRNTDDYNNDHYLHQLGRLQAANGVYTGLITARPGGTAPAGTNMGALRLELKAQGSVTNKTDGTAAVSTPTLNASIEFQGNSHLSINAETSSYDPDSGLFQADIVVKRAAGDSHKITLAGILDPAKELRGSLQVNGFGQYGGNVILKKDDADLEQLSAMARPADPTSGRRSGFIGETVFKSGIKKPVAFIIETPDTTQEEDFLNLFYPNKPVLATFNYGNDAQIVYRQGSWFEQDRRVTGQASISRTSVTASASDSQAINLSVTCVQNPRTFVFVCNHILQSDAQVVAVTTVRPSNGRETPDRDDSSTRDSVVANYHGTGQYDAAGPVATDLTVIYPARTRLAELFELFSPSFERIVQFTFSINDGFGIAVNFTSVKWDSLNGTIDGTQVETQAGHNFTRYLSCKNFQMNVREYNFTCDYSSSLRAFNIPLVFKSNNRSAPVKKPKR